MKKLSNRIIITLVAVSLTMASIVALLGLISYTQGFNGIFIILGSIVLMTIISFLIALKLAKDITKPLDYMEELLTTTALLDLSNVRETKETVNYFNRKDIIGSNLRLIIKLRGEMKNIIISLGDRTANILKTSNILNNALHDTSNSLIEVKDSMEGLNSAYMSQIEYVLGGSEKLNDMSDLINLASEGKKLLINSSIIIQNINQANVSSIEDLLRILDRIRSSTRLLADTKEANISPDYSKAKDLLNHIEGLANQSSLVALSGLVDAGKTGNGERVYAQVADEIRQLSEGIENASFEIKNLLYINRPTSGHKNNRLEELENSLEEANNTLEKVKVKINEGFKLSNTINKAITQLDQSLEQVEKDKEDLLGLVENISTVRQANTGSTEKFSELMEGQVSVMGLIASSTDNLAGKIRELNEILKKVKI